MYISILFILLFAYFQQLIDTTNDMHPISKKELRNLHTEERQNIINKYVDINVNRIWHEAIEKAKLGFTEHKFYRFLCNAKAPHIHYATCMKTLDIPKYNIIMKDLTLFNINIEEINHSIIMKIKRLFPDSEVKEDLDICCNYYKISW